MQHSPQLAENGCQSTALCVCAVRGQLGASSTQLECCIPARPWPHSVSMGPSSRKVAETQHTHKRTGAHASLVRRCLRSRTTLRHRNPNRSAAAVSAARK